MKYQIISSSFELDLKPNENKNFDFVFKDEKIIQLYLTDGDIEGITEFVADGDPWYISFKVGSFISKVPKPNITFIKNCVLATYERHPEQVGSIMKNQSKEYYEHLKKGAGKMVKKRKI